MLLQETNIGEIKKKKKLLHSNIPFKALSYLLSEKTV